MSSKNNRSRVPSYRLHKASGQARVIINGRHLYLGPFGSEESYAEYRRLIANFLSDNPTVRKAKADLQSQQIGNTDLRIVELAELYLQFAETYYRKNGKPTTQICSIKTSLRFLCESFGRSRVIDFSPLALKSLRQQMIEKNLSRNYINDQLDRIKRVFKWGVSEELVPVSVYQSLQTVSGLKRGRSSARETGPVLPVPESDVQAVLPKLSKVVRAMVEFQLLTGCRPGEARIIRPCDVDTLADVWVYRPESHKTEHHGRERRIYIGPKAQQILRPWLDRDPTAYCFSPREAVSCDREAAGNGRSPSARAKRPRPNRRATAYTKDSYNRAIARACERAGIDAWSPNRLRHRRATELRAEFGIEGAQTVLGHSQADVTQVYAERDFTLAERIMLKVG